MVSSHKCIVCKEDPDAYYALPELIAEIADPYEDGDVICFECGDDILSTGILMKMMKSEPDGRAPAQRKVDLYGEYTETWHDDVRDVILSIQRAFKDSKGQAAEIMLALRAACASRDVRRQMHFLKLLFDYTMKSVSTPLVAPTEESLMKALIRVFAKEALLIDPTAIDWVLKTATAASAPS